MASFLVSFMEWELAGASGKFSFRQKATGQVTWSPTLFNVHTNDIENCIPWGLCVTTCKNADDCTQYEFVS